MKLTEYGVSTLLCLAALTACGGSGKHQAQSPQGSTEPPMGVAETTSPQSTPPTTSTEAPTGNETPSNAETTPSSDMSTTSLTDDQILEVTHVANAGEIEQAKLAQQKAKNVRVKRFAVMMVKDHSDADAKGKDLAKKHDLAMSDSPTSTSLKSDAESATQGMQSLSGSDFDRQYIDAQVKEHQAVLDIIDQKLLTNVKSPDIRSMVEAVRTKVAGHLKEAQDIQRSLAR